MDHADTVAKTLEKAARLLQERRFWQRSEHARNAKARAILSQLLQNPELPPKTLPKIKHILALEFGTTRSLARDAVLAALIGFRAEQYLESTQKQP